MAADEALAGRVRELVAELTGGDFAERRMFGGLAFLVGGHLAVAASGAGGLMVRCEPAATDALLARPHTGPVVMRGRPVDGWVRVSEEGARTRAQLGRWVERGVDVARAL
jgi:hypothetical protein